MFKKIKAETALRDSINVVVRKSKGPRYSPTTLDYTFSTMVNGREFTSKEMRHTELSHHFSEQAFIKERKKKFIDYVVNEMKHNKEFPFDEWIPV